MDQLHDSYHSKRDITNYLQNSYLSHTYKNPLSIIVRGYSWGNWTWKTTLHSITIVKWVEVVNRLVTKSTQSCVQVAIKTMYDSWILSVFHAASVTYKAFFIQK